MVRAVFSVQDSLVSTQEDGLVGLNDLQLVETGGGMHLFATARGGGYLTGFDIGDAPGDTAQAEFWQIGYEFLQLESVDLVLRDGNSGPQLYLAGLVGAGMRGLNLDDDGQGALIESQIAVTAPGLSLGQVTEMELFGTSDQGLAAMRGGGLVNVSFGAGTILGTSAINEGPGLTTAYASDILTASHNGASYAFVSYGSENTVAMYQQGNGGSLSYVDRMNASAGLWVENPGAMTTATTIDGALYVVVAATGTDSLSVLSVSDSGMQVVDHVLDTRNTRFDNASHVTSVTVAGQSYVLAAGADSGLSLFVMLPGGRLQHLETFEATLAAPLNGITALEAMAVPDGIRIWASTEAAPYLSEFSVSLQNIGIVHVAGDTGATMGGDILDDVLAGGDGADSIAAGAGDDILMDGAGADTLRGGAGADTFIFARDGDMDVIRDFDPLQDVIDLSGIGTLGGTSELIVASRSWGAFIRFGDEIIEVRTENGSSLNTTHFTDENLITGGRVEVDLSLYPDTGSNEPEPGPVDPPLSGDDIIYVSNGFDYVDGDTGNDTIDGGPQADNLFGLDGADLLMGRGDLDRLFGGDGNDSLYGGDGNDSHFGEWGDDSLWGGEGNDRFFGGSGDDLIDGGPDRDTIYGGIGFDTILGGTGNDNLFGGLNADHFVFANFHGHDTIGDFDTNLPLEQIDLSDMTQINSFEDVAALFQQVGADVVISTGDSSSIRLVNMRLSDLDEGDFTF